MIERERNGYDDNEMLRNHNSNSTVCCLADKAFYFFPLANMIRANISMAKESGRLGG